MHSHINLVNLEPRTSRNWCVITAVEITMRLCATTIALKTRTSLGKVTYGLFSNTIWNMSIEMIVQIRRGTVHFIIKMSISSTYGLALATLLYAWHVRARKRCYSLFSSDIMYPVNFTSFVLYSKHSTHTKNVTVCVTSTHNIPHGCVLWPAHVTTDKNVPTMH